VPTKKRPQELVFSEDENYKVYKIHNLPKQR
jgi:hypothetical protein